MIDVTAALEEQERRLYETLNQQTEALHAARNRYLKERLETGAAVALAETYLAWHNTLDQVARIQADRVVKNIPALNTPRKKAADYKEE